MFFYELVAAKIASSTYKRSDLRLKHSKACLNEVHFEIVFNYFLINGHWFHPENVSACALVSPESTPEMKRKALKIILEARARERANNTGEIRYFINPTREQLNLDATNFLDVLKVFLCELNSSFS